MQNPPKARRIGKRSARRNSFARQRTLDCWLRKRHLPPRRKPHQRQARKKPPPRRSLQVQVPSLRATPPLSPQKALARTAMQLRRSRALLPLGSITHLICWKWSPRRWTRPASVTRRPQSRSTQKCVPSLFHKLAITSDMWTLTRRRDGSRCFYIFILGLLDVFLTSYQGRIQRLRGPGAP